MSHNVFVNSFSEGHVYFFHVLAIMNKVAVNIMCRFCVDINIQLLWIHTKQDNSWIELQEYV